MLLPGRNLVWLAKAVATLDVLSGGHFLVTFVPGLAVGGERSAIGISSAARAEQMEDALPVLRRLWAGEVVSHEGPAGSFADVSVSPQPAQDPFDVWLGGNVPAALERCGRLADGWLPAFCTPDDAAEGKAVIDRVAGEHGRAISPEHFGVSLAYAPEGTDLGRVGDVAVGPAGPGPSAGRDHPGRARRPAPKARGIPRGRVLQVRRASDGAAGGVATRTGGSGGRGGRSADVTRGVPATPTLPTMPERPLTLMAVHAHPDDEAISTGGILARYSAEGVRTVLVTCTNGELGDAPGGIKPGEPGHDESVVVPLRRHGARSELRSVGRVQSGAARLPRLGNGGLAAERRPRFLLAHSGGGRGGPLGRTHARLRAAGGRDVRRERLLRAPGSHSGEPRDARGDRGVGRADQAVLHGHGPFTAARLPRHHGRGRHGTARRGAGEPRLRDARRADHDDDRRQRLHQAEVRVARRARQSERQHLLPEDGRGRLRSASWDRRASCGCRTRRGRRSPRTISSPGCAELEVPSRACAPPGERGRRTRSGVVPTSRCRPGWCRREHGEPIRRDTGRRRRRRRPQPVSRW